MNADSSVIVPLLLTLPREMQQKQPEACPGPLSGPTGTWLGQSEGAITSPPTCMQQSPAQGIRLEMKQAAGGMPAA